MKEYRGTGASEGNACGPAVVFRHEPIAVKTAGNQPGFEAAMKKFHEGRYVIRDELLAMAREAEIKYGPDKAGIYDGYAEILMDDEIEELVKTYIREGSAPEDAVQKAMEQQADELEALGGYMKERSSDLSDLGRRLAAVVSECTPVSMPELKEPCILVADDLSPFETIHLDQNKILGIALDKGGRTGHVSILARSLGIPCVVALGGVCGKIKNGAHCALDGKDGHLIVEPDNITISEFQKKEEARKQQLSILAMKAAEIASTKDGAAILVCANVNSAEEINRVITYGADGVGLFRTEFLYMDTRSPSEEEQFLAYSKVLTAMGKKPMTIRTLDIGGDKFNPNLSLDKEDNPFLGFRGIRFSLERPDIFKPQIRAVLRTAALGNVELMFPMVVSLNEIKQARILVDECRHELAGEGVETGNPHIGIMVETPAAAIMAKEFAGACDFFSIGTNDLTQYTLAADRGNPRLSKLHNPLNPAVLRLMALACDAASNAGIPAGICGELAADYNALPLLIGLGMTKISVPASRIPAIKEKIRSLDSIWCKRITRKALELTDVKSVFDLLSEKGLYD